jgi:hypothetical protein
MSLVIYITMNEPYEEYLIRINPEIKDPEVMERIILMVKENNELRRMTAMIQRQIVQLGGVWDNRYCCCCGSVCDEIYSSS